jgi:Methyltransferase domain
MRLKTRDRWIKDGSDYSVPHLRLRMIAQLINELRPSSFVDFGCAEGLLRTLTPGIGYIGVDFVPPKVAPDFELHLCDLNAEELPDVLGNVDLVTCSGILEYIDDLYGLLAQLHTRTQLKTKILATYYNMNHISRIWQLLCGRTIYTHPDWRNFLSPRGMRALMRKAGFNIDRMIPVGFSVRGSPRVHEAVSQEIAIRMNYWGSYLLAHQFIFVLSK